MHIVFLLAFCKTIDFLSISENDFTKFKQFTDEVMPVILADELLITVMTQFSARGAYLPLAPQGRALMYSGQGAYLFFLINNSMFKIELKQILKLLTITETVTVTVTNC